MYSGEYLYLFQNNRLLSLRFLIFLSQQDHLGLFTSKVECSNPPTCSVKPTDLAISTLSLSKFDLKTIESDFNLHTLRSN